MVINIDNSGISIDTSQWNRSDSPQTVLTLKVNLNEASKAIQRRKNNLFSKWCYNWLFSGKRMILKSYIKLYKKIKTKNILDLYVRAKTKNSRKHGITSLLFWIRKCFHRYDTIQVNISVCVCVFDIIIIKNFGVKRHSEKT